MGTNCLNITLKIDSLLSFLLHNITLIDPLGLELFFFFFILEWFIGQWLVSKQKSSSENSQTQVLDWEWLQKQPMFKKNWKIFRKPQELLLKTTRTKQYLAFHKYNNICFCTVLHVLYFMGCPLWIETTKWWGIKSLTKSKFKLPVSGSIKIKASCNARLLCKVSVRNAGICTPETVPLCAKIH